MQGHANKQHGAGPDFTNLYQDLTLCRFLQEIVHRQTLFQDITDLGHTYTVKNVNFKLFV